MMPGQRLAQLEQGDEGEDGPGIRPAQEIGEGIDDAQPADAPPTASAAASIRGASRPISVAMTPTSSSAAA